MKRLLRIPPRVYALFTDNHGKIYKILLLVPVFITGLYTREYQGPHAVIINNNVGGAMYVMFGSLLFSLVFPRMKAWKVVSLAFGITCLLELLQWFRFPILIRLTQNKILAYLLGNSFNWTDFIFYFVGGVVAFGLLLMLQHNDRGVAVTPEV